MPANQCMDLAIPDAAHGVLRPPACFRGLQLMHTLADKAAHSNRSTSHTRPAPEETMRTRLLLKIFILLVAGQTSCVVQSDPAIGETGPPGPAGEKGAPGDDQWTRDDDAIHYTDGDVGVGTSAPNLASWDRAVTVSSGVKTNSRVGLELVGNALEPGSCYAGVSFHNAQSQYPSKVAAEICAEVPANSNPAEGLLSVYLADKNGALSEPAATLDALGILSVNAIRTRDYGKIIAYHGETTMVQVPWAPEEVAANSGALRMWTGNGPNLRDIVDCNVGPDANARIDNGWDVDYPGRYTAMFTSCGVPKAPCIQLSWAGYELRLWSADDTLVAGPASGRVDLNLVYYAGSWHIALMSGNVGKYMFSCA